MNEERKFKHLMLDIETMGNESYSAITSIGAVEFDIETGETGDEFYVVVGLQSCLDAGLIVNASTILWWMKQNDQARADLTGTIGISLKDALLSFNLFCDSKYQIWGNSARFDCGILQNAYNIVGIPIPWKYGSERCLRTLVAFNPKVKATTLNIGTAHNAIDDCKFQIKYCHETWISLKNK